MSKRQKIQRTHVDARTVILPGSVWRSELAYELSHSGIVEAERAATSILQRIVARAGWPRETHLVAQSQVVDANLIHAMAAPEVTL